jgi:hypothetical protein
VRKIIIWLAFLVCLSCSGRADLVGRYETRHQGPDGPVSVVMILAEDGSGKWEIGGEVLNFSWTPVAGGVRVHARDGAVVEGVLEGDDVRLDVPGVGKLLFERS